MKTLSTIAKKQFLSEENEGKIVELMAVLGGYRKLEEPTLSTEICCSICSGTEHGAPYYDPPTDNRRVWICHNGLCGSNNRFSSHRATTTPPTQKEAILWPLFCETNGIGDIHHKVKFDNLQQDASKIDCLRKFCKHPNGLIVMYGDPGTGKTYSAMATCQLFTRKNPSAIFKTQRQLYEEWLDQSKAMNWSSSLQNCNILVIDDFGTTETTPTFMAFLMELINRRTQWTDKGTILTTNLNADMLAKYCGEALSDRLKTAIYFNFTGKSRRKTTIL